MTEITGKLFTGERALFASEDLALKDVIFADGESPMKESRNIVLDGCEFRWKYPLWYCKNVKVGRTAWQDTARAGVWYTDGAEFTSCVIRAPKTFRRCRGLILRDVDLFNAAETLWSCEDVVLERVTARGDYFGMNSRGLKIKDFRLDGNYAFDGGRDIEISDAVMLTKDAFWNSENVTVRDSYISGEYFGWNSRNITLINCTVSSLQGMCYIENLVMINCKTPDTTLAFEYSSVDAEIPVEIDSVFNPSSGRISADRIGEITLDEKRIDPSKTLIEEREGKSAE